MFERFEAGEGSSDRSGTGQSGSSCVPTRTKCSLRAAAISAGLCVRVSAEVVFAEGAG